ncbi:isochorismate synthase MenF [Vibrio cidicii]|uniref:isochorismate synthase n=1 Tax=Vibrio cidicii TaxID=1763883 RepID=UPI0018C20995|nr:isochorismate synthase MenF [Vibrio cidicii]
MVMKRQVVGYASMSEQLIENELSSSPFFFASANSSMLASGVAQSFNQAIPFSQLAQQEKVMLEKAKSTECENPVLFGVVPFDETTPTQFVIPQKLYVSSSTRTGHHQTQQSCAAKIISSPTGTHYKNGVSSLLSMFRPEYLSKVVLSRSLEIATEQEIAQPALLRNLLSINSRGYTFAARIDSERKLIGASPELLIAKKGSHLISNPLAGSRPRTECESENNLRRESLLNTGKDLHEHGLVVEEVERVMNRYCHNLYAPMVPSVIETETMLHLSTVLEGQVDDPNVSALQVAAELHPTPAVCGYPRQSAYDAIKQLEGFDRGYFTGMVGWCDARGNGEWVVTIRCAEVTSHQMKVYAGAGIVTESLPESELDETGAKMKTILSAAGIQLNELLTA